MSSIQARIVGVGLSFLLIFLSGLWVSRSGKPYHAGIFAIHKLIGLVVGILLAMIVLQTHRMDPLGLLEIGAVVVTVLLFVGTVAGGALLSIDRPLPAVVQRLHQVVPVLTVLSTSGTLYLLLSAR